MKKFTYILFVAALFAFNSCDLDKLPSGDIMTEGQKEDVIAPSPEKLEADVNGLAAGLTRYDIIGKSALNHFDYGLPSVYLMLESAGQDMVANHDGYNWFRDSQHYRDRLITSAENEMIWKTFYYNILAANKVLEFAPEGVEERRLQIFRAQALGFRAFSYLNLVQIYQFTYKNSQNKPAVPLILEAAEPLGYDNPRATVQAIYKAIMDDLNEVITLLEGYRAENKAKISLNVAYGLRARANLLMGEGKAAADDAQKAAIGFSPATIEQVSKPGFNNVKAANWIWGIIITPESDVVKSGILNWPSHLCSLVGNGYTTLTETYRKANNLFWNEIPESDIRREWFAHKVIPVLKADGSQLFDRDGNPVTTVTSKLVESLQFNGYLGYTLGWDQYTNVKFHAYDDILLNASNASDWPLMRVEEMIFIQAEGLAMSGDLGGAKTILENFVTANRDPEFASQATTPEEFIDEVWLQRRMELWGEGFSFFDLMRLEKGVTRVNVNAGKGEEDSSYPEAVRFNFPANDPHLLYPIPEVEVNVNDGITPEDNNKPGDALKPIPKPK